MSGRMLAACLEVGITYHSNICKERAAINTSLPAVCKVTVSSWDQGKIVALETKHGLRFNSRSREREQCTIL